MIFEFDKNIYDRNLLVEAMESSLNKTLPIVEKSVSFEVDCTEEDFLEISDSYIYIYNEKN